MKTKNERKKRKVCVLQSSSLDDTLTQGQRLYLTLIIIFIIFIALHRVRSMRVRTVFFLSRKNTENKSCGNS